MSTRLEGVGVLDPTCGSGTFLYHAARRILEAPEMDQLSPGQQADITASLVHGIDVHPVAVEIAKTNMMRVLPTTPRAGAGAIQIRMGDSLMADNQSTSIFDVEGTMRIVTPKGREISLPMSFVRRVSFAEDMGRVVSAAVDDQPIAPAVLIGLDTADRKDLKRARDELAETIDNEGNSVWTWYAVNLAGPHLLSEQKVDRIVANPPWVKLSEIQHVPRKRAMEQFGQNLGIYQGGKQAPHTDIAAFFIRRARELYLENPGSDPAIWLVKKSSLRAGQWAAFRELHHGTLAQSVDLEDLQPFGSGDATRCCLLLEHRPMARTTAPALRATMPVDDATKQPAARPQPDETFETALKRIRFMPTPKQPVQRPSAYFTDTGEAEFQQGATIVPHVLTIAETTSPATRRDRVRVTTRKSSKAPGNIVEPRRIEVPKHWLTDLFSSSTVTRKETEPRTVPEVGRHHACGTYARRERGRGRHPVLVPSSDERRGSLPDDPTKHELPAARLHERQGKWTPLRPASMAEGADPPLRRDRPAAPRYRGALHTRRENRHGNRGHGTQESAKAKTTQPLQGCARGTDGRRHQRGDGPLCTATAAGPSNRTCAVTKGVTVNTAGQDHQFDEPPAGGAGYVGGRVVQGQTARVNTEENTR